MDIKDVNTLNVLDSVGANTSLFLFDAVENYGYQMTISHFLNYINRQTGADIGTNEDLTTSNKSTIVDAINELKGDIGSRSNLRTSATSNLVAAINELRTELSTMSGVVPSLDNHTMMFTNILNEIGTMTNLGTTNKSSLVEALNEVNEKLGDFARLNTTAKSSVVAALNELVSAINDKSSGTLSDGGSVDTAISQLRANLGNLANIDSGIDKSSLVASVNNLLSRIKSVESNVSGMQTTFSSISTQTSTTTSSSSNGTVSSVGTIGGNITGLKIYDTFDGGVRNDMSIKAGTLVLTAGFYTVGDAGDGWYYITTSDGVDGNYYVTAAMIGNGYSLLPELKLKNGLYGYPMEPKGVRNVKRWGAKGDCIHDDWANIQACIDYGYRNNPGIVYLPAGIYKITKTLFVSHNTFIYGDGDGECHDQNSPNGNGGGTEIAFYPSASFKTGLTTADGTIQAETFQTDSSSEGQYAIAVVLMGFENTADEFKQSNKPMFQRDFHDIQIRDYSKRTDTIGLQARNLQNRATISRVRVENFGFCGILLDEVWKHGGKTGVAFTYGGNAPAFCAVRDCFIENNVGTGHYGMIIRSAHGPMIIENVGVDSSTSNKVGTQFLIVADAVQPPYAVITLSSCKFEFGSAAPGYGSEEINAIKVKSLNGSTPFKGLINVIGCGGGSGYSAITNCRGGAFINVDAASAAQTVVNIMGCVVGGFTYATIFGNDKVTLGATTKRYGFKTLGDNLLQS